MTPHDKFRLGARLGAALDRLTRDPDARVTSVVRGALMFYVIYHSLALLPYHEFVWGRSMPAFQAAAPPDSLLAMTLSWGTIAADHGLQLWVVLAQVSCAALALFGVAPRLMVPIVYVLTMNVNAMNRVILDGGNNLSQLLLVYAIAMEAGRAGPAGSRRRALANSLSNCGLFVARLQVAAVYLCAGLYKANGELWQNGMALFYIFQVDDYTHPVAHELILAAPFVSVLGSYFTLAFQLSFPWVVWRSGWPRNLVIGAGLMLHLGIALVMGLASFGLVMCLSYTVFVRPETAARICGVLAGLRRAIRGAASSFASRVPALTTPTGR